MSLAILAEKLHKPLIAAVGAVSPVCLFLSASDMKSRAITRHARAATAEEAWQAALAGLKDALAPKGTEPTILRADWVTSREQVPWAEALRRIRGTRRNYFRQGIAFDQDWKTVFTEQELNASAMLNIGGDNAYGEFNARNSAFYCKQRFDCELPEPDKLSKVELFETKGLFCETDGPVYGMSGSGPEAGRRDMERTDAATVHSCITAGADWLARQCGRDGRFDYGFFPCFDRPIPTYNTLRHISSAWSLLDVYRVTGDKALRTAAERAMKYAMQHFARRLVLSDGKEALFFEDRESGEIKLGCNGVALLLFSTYTEITNSKRYIPLMQALARGIMHLQNDEGGFTHVLNSSDFSVKEAFRIVYYDGEAVFGLLRLYGITRARPLLDAVEKAFDCFIRNNHWKHHDHWLSYSVNELTRWKPEAKYFEFGINNFLNYLPFVRRRDTAFPTLLELMMAADAMLRRMEDMPEMQGLLARVDKNRFYDALQYRAGHLLNSFFWPETAMFFKNPQRICGSFYIRHHAFRTRIDDVEHYISGLTAYLQAMEYLPAVQAAPAHRDSSPAPVRDRIPAAGRNMLRVGLLRENVSNFWRTQSAFCTLFYVAKQFDIEMCLFSFDDIDFSNNTVNAVFLVGNDKVRRTVPVPEIIDNQIYEGRKELALSRLEDRCIFLRHSLKTSKIKTYEKLVKNGKFAEFLIQTYTVGDYDIFLEKFHELDEDVIIKPTRSCRGKGIQRITRKADHFTIAASNRHREFSAEELKEHVSEVLSDREHIIQPYIQSKTFQGNPFDIRVHCRRGKDGIFRVTPYPRIGNDKGVVSNIVSGGYSMNYEVFLKREFGNRWKKVFETIADFGSKFPEYYQSLFPVRLFDVGVDIGVCTAGNDIRYKIFEVNTYLDGQFFGIDDALTHFEYYRYMKESRLTGCF